MADRAVVDVAVEGSVTARIHVDDEVELRHNKGTFTVDYSQREVLEWRVVASPATPFEITLSPRAGTLVMVGKHPIKRKTAKNATLSAGFRHFSIKTRGAK